MNDLTLLTDEALGEGNDPDLDGLGFGTYANVLGKAALGTPGPLTIGVFGEWGTGKTSLMRMIKSHLAGKDQVVTVWFNAWRYEKETHPIVPLVATIVREMERNKTALSKLKDGGAALIRSLRAVAYGFSAKSKIQVPGFAEVEASFVAKDMIERTEALTPDPLLDRSLYYEAFERLSALSLSGKVRIVVIIDDLDRCFPDLAIRLLESIKLVLSQPGFVFILGVARSVIEGYLQHRYQKRYGIKDFKGQSYLDKIVQVPFHIPSHRSRMDTFSEKILGRVDATFKEKMKSVMPIIGSASGSNPRATVRFVNNLMIDVAINLELVKINKMTVIPIEYFAVTRCLQLRWPQTFTILTNEDDLCELVADWKEENLAEITKSNNTNEANLASTLAVDKDLRTLLFTEQGRSWLKNHEQRRATVDFLLTQRGESDEYTAGAPKMYDVFFCYSPADSEMVSKIANYLKMNGLQVFMDTTIVDTRHFSKVFELSLRGSKAAAFFFSPHYFSSEWMAADLMVRFEQISKSEEYRLIPVILPKTDITNIPVFFRKYFWIDLRDGINDPMLEKFVHSLKF